MDEQMTPLSDLGLTDPQAQQDEVLAFLQQLAALMQGGGGQAFGGSGTNPGSLVTQAMVDALGPQASERTGLLPHQTPAGIDTSPGVMSQVGAPIDMRSANPEWMVPQTGLEGILAGGNAPGNITSYAGGKPSTTYVPETPRGQRAVAQPQQPSQPEGLGLTDAEHQAAIRGYTSRGEPVPAVLQGNAPPPQATFIPSTTTSKIDPKALAKHAAIVKELVKNHYTATQAGQIADQAVPEVAQIQRAEKQNERRETKQDQSDIQRTNLREKYVLENQSNLFKRGTGESFLGQGKAPENTEQILKDYAVLKPENAKDMRQLDMVGGYVDSFKKLLTEIKPLLSSQKQGISGRLGAGTGVAYLRAQGDARVRKMDALTSQITLLARGFGGDSRVSDSEMERLDKAIITGWTTKEGSDATLSVLDDFIKNRGSSLGFDKYKSMGQRPKQAPDESSVLHNKDKKGRPIISRDNGLNWETE